MFKNADILTAIVTPFNEQDQIDFKSLKTLTEHLLATGSHGFIIGGTTGETPNLTHDEKMNLYTQFAQIVDGRVPVIAGTGSNNTKQTIEFTKEVGKIPGIDMALVVVPYYNKPNQRGMKAHFTAVADQSPVPIAIYNIPGRTGVTMANGTVVALASHPNIQAVKQCTTLDDLQYLVENTPEDFMVYTGEDAQALPAIAIGAQGVVSVAAHVYGKDMRQMLDAFYEGNTNLAASLQRKLTPKMQALFLYPSPSPVKAVLNAQGYQVGGCRLPILPLNKSEQQTLAQALGLKKDALEASKLAQLGVKND
ncbi:4-hydroxy-tetrahydrodipicolinate synthase [Pediococcus cellicola]|uniref:4-hydroxy-tetrahydrodipicolinate synthase n=1 Tax=Pediococcus cellicola TaxID=319652 RepID=A0A0R2J079_9LACO|nr:4-hydroxy-tetrahydrodipicolinate synthase [Pediococcus cellicola]KRN67373.1 dihydrodipicolinate synthase [Pediococcus cellicola]GEL15925.1 4-hydroxy-tetrahydrodipicolinate synthase [Pediococcus cellicola]